MLKKKFNFSVQNLASASAAKLQKQSPQSAGSVQCSNGKGRRSLSELQVQPSTSSAQQGSTSLGIAVNIKIDKELNNDNVSLFSSRCGSSISIPFKWIFAKE